MAIDVPGIGSQVAEVIEDIAGTEIDVGHEVRLVPLPQLALLHVSKIDTVGKRVVHRTSPPVEQTASAQS